MRKKQSGLSLVELMVSIAIGLLLFAGLTTLFVNSSHSQAELFKSSQQIENGRYATELLVRDLHHAGFYGEFNYLPPADGSPVTYPAALPDPCVSALANLTNALALPLQGYDDATGDPIACLDDLDHVDGTDVLVVRRADTEILLDTGGQHGVPANPTASATPVQNEVYLQGDANTVELQLGSGAAIDKTKKANGSAATIARKDYSVTPTGVAAGYLRKYRVHIYFIAPCSVPNGGGTNCTGADDDGGNPIPTLKRLELSAVAGNLAFRIVPLVEGIENLQVEYGLDTAPPASASNPTGLPGDGSPEDYVAAPGAADWRDVVAAKIFLLARNTERSPGYIDAKTYQLGTNVAATVTPGGNFKRHLFSAEVRLINPSSRREIP